MTRAGAVDAAGGSVTPVAAGAAVPRVVGEVETRTVARGQPGEAARRAGAERADRSSRTHVAAGAAVRRVDLHVGARRAGAGVFPDDTVGAPADAATAVESLVAGVETRAAVPVVVHRPHALRATQYFSLAARRGAPAVGARLILRAGPAATSAVGRVAAHVDAGAIAQQASRAALHARAVGAVLIACAHRAARAAVRPVILQRHAARAALREAGAAAPDARACLTQSPVAARFTAGAAVGRVTARVDAGAVTHRQFCGADAEA